MAGLALFFCLDYLEQKCGIPTRIVIIPSTSIHTSDSTRGSGRRVSVTCKHMVYYFSKTKTCAVMWTFLHTNWRAAAQTAQTSTKTKNCNIQYNTRCRAWYPYPRVKTNRTKNCFINWCLFNQKNSKWHLANFRECWYRWKCVKYCKTLIYSLDLFILMF